LKQVWGADYGRDSISLRLYIGYLRHKIEKNPALPQLIQNEWGVGYRFG
jgi:two-component system KDP operon response regulator KdpE